jgi:hypothetical protein
VCVCGWVGGWVGGCVCVGVGGVGGGGRARAYVCGVRGVLPILAALSSVPINHAHTRRENPPPPPSQHMYTAITPHQQAAGTHRQLLLVLAHILLGHPQRVAVHVHPHHVLRAKHGGADAQHGLGGRTRGGCAGKGKEVATVKMQASHRVGGVHACSRRQRIRSTHSLRRQQYQQKLVSCLKLLQGMLTQYAAQQGRTPTVPQPRSITVWPSNSS